MTLRFLLITCLFLWSSFAQALPGDMAAQSCKELTRQMTQRMSGDISAALQGSITNNPFSDIVEEATSELGNIDYVRVRPPLLEAFVEFCTQPSFQQSEDIEVGAALDKALTRLGLDKSVEHWGMADWPGLDPQTSSCQDFIDATWALPAEVRFRPYNDFLTVVVNWYWAAYDLSQPGAREKSETAKRMVAMSGSALQSEPCGPLVQRIFEEHGLQLR